MGRAEINTEKVMWIAENGIGVGHIKTYITTTTSFVLLLPYTYPSRLSYRFSYIVLLASASACTSASTSASAFFFSIFYSASPHPPKLALLMETVCYLTT